MSQRLNQEREAELQPVRIEHAITELKKIGKNAIVLKDETKIMFEHNGFIVTFYPYSGWASGRSIKDGRGLDNLLKQLK